MYEILWKPGQLTRENCEVTSATKQKFRRLTRDSEGNVGESIDREILGTNAERRKAEGTPHG